MCIKKGDQDQCQVLEKEMNLDCFWHQQGTCSNLLHVHRKKINIKYFLAFYAKIKIKQTPIISLIADISDSQYNQILGTFKRKSLIKILIKFSKLKTQLEKYFCYLEYNYLHILMVTDFSSKICLQTPSCLSKLLKHIMGARIFLYFLNNALKYLPS